MVGTLDINGCLSGDQYSQLHVHVLLQVLRLVCIQSICNNGFKPKLLDYYRREIIQVSTFITYENYVNKIQPS